MAGRGRGRGGRWGGRGKSDPSVAVPGNELTAIASQPPPLFPLLNRKPHPLVPSVEVDYQLLMKQIFIGRMQLSPSYLKMPLDKNEENPVQEIDKLVAQIPSAKEKYDWSLFPPELRPKLVARRRVKKIRVQDVDKLDLDKLEELEKTNASDGDENVKDAEVEEEELEEVIEDEEMDDGTDYAHNYFENGEDYEDDDEDESAFS